MITKIGQGRTSRVYLAKALDSTREKVAIKIFTIDFLKKSDHSDRGVAKEAAILDLIKENKMITKFRGLGSNGIIECIPSREKIQDITYLILDYVPMNLYYGLLKPNHKKPPVALGEKFGRFLLE